MQRPEYLNSFLFDWDLLNVVIGGRSALDNRYFSGRITNEQVICFLKGYGLDPNDPVNKAELFGNFQEAVQFIKRFFLKEGNPEGVDLKIPNSIFMMTDISELFFMATGNKSNISLEERLWSEIILKVMHTIVHIDKDLRTNYLSAIQTQVFDRFYKFIYRDQNNQLFLGDKNSNVEIRLVDFQTKSKKSRESVIIKLLHKAENVAEELFDRIGIRFITENKLDIIRVVKFLIEQSVVIPHNIKPSRSSNTLIDLPRFKISYLKLLRKAVRCQMTESEFQEKLNQVIHAPGELEGNRNPHSSVEYRSIQFTCRQLIKYKNPFLGGFSAVRTLAKQDKGSELAKKVLELDLSHISRDTRFFYPFEVQIVDIESHKRNTEGEASHLEYKKSQLKSALKRIFKPLLLHKKIDLNSL